MKDNQPTGDPLISIWKQNIKDAIIREDYEACAKWRDRINARLKELFAEVAEKVKPKKKNEGDGQE